MSLFRLDLVTSCLPLLGGYGALTRGVYQHLTLNGNYKTKSKTNFFRRLSMPCVILPRCRHRRCCQSDNADRASMPFLRCCLEAMLSSRQCRFHDAVRRPCCHRDNADLASMPFLRCCLEAMLTTVNADTDRRGIAATNGLTFARPLFFIVAL